VSKDDLYNAAQRDSPSYVDLPKSWPGILAWVTVKLVYTHQREDQQLLLAAYQANIQAMDAFTSQLRSMQDTIDEAHRRAFIESPK
jgi:hypothetical protein